MGLDAYRYVDGLHDPFDVVVLVLLLALVPCLVAVVTIVLRRSDADLRTSLTAKPTGRLTKLPLVGRFVVARLPRWGLLLLAVIPAWVAVDVDQRILDELLTLPWGGWLALLPIVVGTLAGMLLALRPRPRALVPAGIATAALTVVVAVLFAGQFAAPAGGSDDDARPGEPPVRLVTPTPTAPGTTPSPEPTTSVQPTMPAGTYEPSQVRLPNGTYTTCGICLKGHGGTPVAVAMSTPGIVEAILPGSTTVQVGDLSELRPCSEREGSDSTLLDVPHDAITTFDGSVFPLDRDLPVALIADLESEGGERVTWVWRRIEGVTYTGLVRTDQIRR